MTFKHKLSKRLALDGISPPRRREERTVALLFVVVLAAFACSAPAAPKSVKLVEPGPGVPVFDSTNANYVLHVFEDWSSYASVNDIGTQNRVDGGGRWDGNGAFKSFSTNNNDPWFGKKTLTLDYVTAPGSGQSLGHGLNLTEVGGTPRQYLNAATAKEALVIEWAWRFTGTSIYIGKIADWQPYAGTDRFNYQTSYDPLGAQRSDNGINGCDADPLCSKYYTHGTPNAQGTLPLGGWGVGFARGLSGSSPTPGVWFYTQNRGYPQVAWGSNGVNMLDNAWRRTILRLTLNVNGVMGTGRIEEWLEKAGEPVVKVMEYVGDVGGFDQGLVKSRDANLGGNTWFTPGATLHWYNLSAVGGIFNGGSNVHLGYMRIWSMPRE
jgi:hypothetical protein